jgi:hypothetical protein
MGDCEKSWSTCLVSKSRLEPVCTELDEVFGLFPRDVPVELVQEVCPGGGHGGGMSLYRGDR